MMPTQIIARTEQTMRLRDGRTLGYGEFGLPNGKPIFFFHGWGDSRLTRHPDDTLTAAAAVRLITVDRPGFGLSDFQTHRTLLDWPSDIIQLADKLGLSRFGILGHSGAGPHALACAYKIPDRLAAVGISSGFAPMDRPNGTDGLSKQMQQGVKMFRHMPWMARLAFASLPKQYRSNAKQAFEKQFGPLLSSADRAVMENREVCDNHLQGAVEALRQGSTGLAHEAVLFMGRPWGFCPEDIRVKVWLWYGQDDAVVPPQMGQYLAHAIPNSHFTLFPGEGHMLHITHWTELLTTLANQL